MNTTIHSTYWLSEDGKIQFDTVYNVQYDPGCDQLVKSVLWGDVLAIDISLYGYIRRDQYPVDPERRRLFTVDLVTNKTYVIEVMHVDILGQVFDDIGKKDTLEVKGWLIIDSEVDIESNISARAWIKWAAIKGVKTSESFQYILSGGKV